MEVKSVETTPLLWSNSVKNAGQCTETEKTGSDLNAIEDHVKPSKKAVLLFLPPPLDPLSIPGCCHCNAAPCNRKRDGRKGWHGSLAAWQQNIHCEGVRDL